MLNTLFAEITPTEENQLRTVTNPYQTISLKSIYDFTFTRHSQFKNKYHLVLGRTMLMVKIYTQMWCLKFSKNHCSVWKPDEQSKQVRGTNSCVGRHLVTLNFHLSSKSHSSRSCPSVAYKNSKTSLFAFPVKLINGGGRARYISVYKQASWKSEVEITVVKDSSALIVGGKQGRGACQFYWKSPLFAMITAWK